MKNIKTAILHYTAPPIVGGVEAVIHAHARVLNRHGYSVTMISGRGEKTSFPSGVDFIKIPLMDTQHKQILQISKQLEQGKVPSSFEGTKVCLIDVLEMYIGEFDNVIVHNVFTKHFNLPLTAALYSLLESGTIQRCIAWCHDFTWTSPSSRSKVYPGYPWDLLRTYYQNITYVVVSQRRRKKLASLLKCSPKEIQVIYNGVDPYELLGFTAEGQDLITRLGLLESDLTLLMPIRVTKAKNIEYALKVLAALKDMDYDPKLIVTGPPDPHDSKNTTYFNSLKELRKQLDLEEEMSFVYESGPDPDQPYVIDMDVVGDLYKISDLIFMPSHREGFGIPIVEAGLVGVPIVCTDIPSAREIGGESVILIDTSDTPEHVAEQIFSWAERNPTYHLRRQVRQQLTWEAIFERDIEPLLVEEISN